MTIRLQQAEINRIAFEEMTTQQINEYMIELQKEITKALQAKYNRWNKETKRYNDTSSIPKQ